MSAPRTTLGEVFAGAVCFVLDGFREMHTQRVEANLDAKAPPDMEDGSTLSRIAASLTMRAHENGEAAACVFVLKLDDLGYANFCRLRQMLNEEAHARDLDPPDDDDKDRYRRRRDLVESACGYPYESFVGIRQENDAQLGADGLWRVLGVYTPPTLQGGAP